MYEIKSDVVNNKIMNNEWLVGYLGNMYVEE
jgi:hypothetical protein